MLIIIDGSQPIDDREYSRLVDLLKQKECASVNIYAFDFSSSNIELREKLKPLADLLRARDITITHNRQESLPIGNPFAINRLDWLKTNKDTLAVYAIAKNKENIKLLIDNYNRYSTTKMTLQTIPNHFMLLSNQYLTRNAFAYLLFFLSVAGFFAGLAVLPQGSAFALITWGAGIAAGITGWCLHKSDTSMYDTTNRNSFYYQGIQSLGPLSGFNPFHPSFGPPLHD